MEMLMKGAGVSYMATGLYGQAKRVGLEAIKQQPASILALVEAWHCDSALSEFADAVGRAFLPK